MPKSRVWAMAGARGKVVNDDARRWLSGQLPTAEYYAKVYAEELERADAQVERAIQRRVEHIRAIRSATSD